MTLGMIELLDTFLPTTLVIGPGTLSRIGELARQLGFRRTLLVADRGMILTGYGDRARELLAAQGIEVFHFGDFTSNPDSRMIERGRTFAAELDIDSLVGIGGGSSLDCAKGINFVLTNGGSISTFRGYGKATKPLLPMIAVSTTAGTGSEAQSYALISDAETHAKMACGDPGAAFRVAILDPELTVTQPREVTAAGGFDAISHAVESYVTTERNQQSDSLAAAAWQLLDGNYQRVLSEPSDLEARGAMQYAAFLAGAAIEKSMLGATHACANPLTARYGTDHGVAIAALLPSVVRFNVPVVNSRYEELMRLSAEKPAALADRLEELKEIAGLPRQLRSMGVSRDELPLLADDAALQWTGRFNPRPFDREAALEIYQAAY
jgi:alcohol dehydrogenase